MDSQLLTGKLVRLTARDEQDIDAIVSWNRDTRYVQLLAVEPVTPANPKQVRELIERERSLRSFPFGVRTLSDGKLIGFVVLLNVNHVHGECFVGIGIGNSEYRSKGFGSDAMNVALRYAFLELNMHRVALDAIASNTRAIRSYEKVGFVHEGRTRGTDYRNSVRDDLVSMGILRSEWLARQGS